MVNHICPSDYIGSFLFLLYFQSNHNNRCWVFVGNSTLEPLPRWARWQSIAATSYTTDRRQPSYTICGVSLPQYNITCFGSLNGTGLMNPPRAQPFADMISYGTRMCALHRLELICWNNDGVGRAYSPFLLGNYRMTVNVTSTHGIDAPFCSVRDFIPCATLPYAMKQYDRIALTFDVAGLAHLTAHDPVIVSRDAVTICDSRARPSKNTTWKHHQHGKDLSNVDVYLTKNHHENNDPALTSSPSLSPTTTLGGALRIQIAHAHHVVLEGIVLTGVVNTKTHQLQPV
jgi:hypothetical protein